MATLKTEEIRKMSKDDREKRLKELRLELVRSKAGKSNTKSKEIKKIIARILTLNKSDEEALKNK